MTTDQENHSNETAMNQEELIRKASTHSSVYQSIMSLCCKALVWAIVSALRDGKTIRIRTLGTFIPVEKKARECRNPRTGEKMISKNRMTIVFRPSKSFKFK